MSSNTISLSLLALAASALAVPFPSGSGAPWPMPSGSGMPYPIGNSTGIYLPTSGQPRHHRQSQTTVTATASTDLTVTAYSTVLAAAAAESGCTTTPTLTSTVTNKVYVTVTPGQSSSAAAAPVASSAYSSSSVEAAPVASSASSASINVAQYSAVSSAAATSAAATSAAATSAVSYSTPSSVVASSSYAASSSASATSSAASSSSSSSSSSGTKRGLAYNDASLLASFDNTQTSWCYNWVQTAGGDTSGNMYIPMLWNASSETGSAGYERTQTWVANAKAAISSGATALMSFNEPDLPAQANMEPADAATQYKTWISDEFSDAGVTLIAPAVTNGGGDMGLTWMTNFLDACSDCKIDAVNIHWYDSATNIDYFKQHVNDAHTKSGGKKVWFTEFAASGSDDEISTFLETVLPWLDEQDFVEKYSYYMVADGILNSGSSLSTIGKTYATYTG